MNPVRLFEQRLNRLHQLPVAVIIHIIGVIFSGAGANVYIVVVVIRVVGYITCPRHPIGCELCYISPFTISLIAT